MSKLIVLAGAPESDAIDWAAVDLLDDFAEPVSRFAGWTTPSLAADDSTHRQPQLSQLPQPSQPSQPSQPDRPVWRALSAKRGVDAAEGQPFVQQEQVTGGGHSRPAEHQPYGRAEFLTTAQGSSFSTTPGMTRTPLHPGSISGSFETQPLSVRVPQAMPMPAAENAEAHVEANVEAHVEMEAVSSFEEEGDTTLSQFLEHSLAAHNELPSSLPDLSELWDKKQTGAEEQEGERQGRQDRQDNLINRGGLGGAQGRQKSDRPSAQAVQAPTPPQPATLVPPKASQVSEHSQTLPQQRLLLPAALPPLPARWGPLTDLAAIPGAAYLVGVAPQTVTISAVVAVIAVAVPRAVQTRWGGTASRVEVVAGDETRAGFGVTFWGVGDVGAGRGGGGGGASDGTTTMKTVLSLRPQDVVLLRHVALHTFGNRVYGSSLRRDQTKVHVLLRRRRRGSMGADAEDAEDAEDADAADAARALLAKVDRVRAWALRCVGGAGPQLREERDGNSEEKDGRDDGDGRDDTNRSGAATRHSRGRSWDMPPADTQEDGSLIKV